MEDIGTPYCRKGSCYQRGGASSTREVVIIYDDFLLDDGGVDDEASYLISTRDGLKK